MIKKIKNYLLLTVAMLSLSAPALVPAVAYGANVDTNNTINKGLCSGVTDATGSQGGGCFNTSPQANDTLKNVAKTVVNIFSIIVGIIAVIMIIYGGFRYITSGGSSEKVGNAKNTLIYAIIGLIIVALAQFIVHYVLTTASNSVQ